MFFRGSRHVTLALLGLSYTVGETLHFLLGVVSMDMARDIGYGDKACYDVIDGENGCNKIMDSER